MKRYLVFARTEYAEPLSHLGELGVADGEDAGALARERFGAHWLELVLVPEAAIEWVVREAGVGTSA